MEFKFIADSMLGKLAKWLRIMGFDTVYFIKGDDCNLIDIAEKEGRWILTRDTKLISEKIYHKVIFIKSDKYMIQLKEIMDKLKISLNELKLFTRCSICNNKLEKVKKETVQGKVPDFIFRNNFDFSKCGNCNRIFWEGSHRYSVLKTIHNITIN